VMGYAMRTDRYRLVVWKDRRRPNDKPLFIELYDHKLDPDETINIAAQNPLIVDTLMVTFNGGWRASLKGYKN
ncbi:MAG: hypothetical protein ABIO76_06415, partial [Ginsengibacter sp.]